jgi:hypothetical protein
MPYDVIYDVMFGKSCKIELFVGRARDGIETRTPGKS